MTDATAGFAVHSKTEGDRTVIRLIGELDLEVADRVRRALDRAARASRIVIDLSRLSFMDVTGIHLLFEARERCAALQIIRGPASVQRALEVLDLERDFEFVDEPRAIHAG